MFEASPLIGTLVVGIGLAFVFGTIAHRLRLAPIVGYLVAGVVVSPFTPGIVADQNLASQFADIGVILLMFGVGLHFSLEDLFSVRRIAIPGALTQMFVVAGLGTLVGWMLGFTDGLMEATSNRGRSAGCANTAHPPIASTISAPASGVATRRSPPPRSR